MSATTSGAPVIPAIPPNFSLDDQTAPFTFSVNDPGKCQIANFTAPTLVDANVAITLAFDIVNNRVSPATVIYQLLEDGQAVKQSAPIVIANGATAHQSDTIPAEAAIGSSHTGQIQIFRQTS